jgi:hypothetical protein
MGDLLGHRFDAVAAILRNKPFDPLVVIAIQDQVLRAADYEAVEIADFRPLESPRRGFELRKAEVRFCARQSDIGDDANGEIGGQRHDAAYRRVQIYNFDGCRIVTGKERGIGLAVVQDFSRRVSEN